MFIKYLIVTNGGNYPSHIVLGGNSPEDQLTQEEIYQRQLSERRGNCPGGNCLGVIVLWAIILGENCPGGDCLGGNFLGAGAIVLGDNCTWGYCPGESCPVPHYISHIRKICFFLNIFFSFYHNISVFISLQRLKVSSSL